MKPHFANLETSLSARAATIEAIHREVAAARATARSRAFGHALKMIGAGMGAVLTAIATWPAKRDTYKALDQLSDKQLADIGLARGEISRVFEPGFAAQAANDGVLPTGRAA
jgi:uncharacterized protein YjiS (DUF1127 family)